MGSLSLLQGIFSSQGSNPCLPHCWQILYQLSRKGKGRGGVKCPHCNAWHHTRRPSATTTTKSYHLLHVDWLPGTGVSTFLALSHLILKQSFFIYFIIIIGGVALSVLCCEQAFSSCSEQGLRFVGVHRFKSTDSAVEVHSLSSSAASGSFLVQPGIEPVSPALAGRFLTTGPPGKSLKQS